MTNHSPQIQNLKVQRWVVLVSIVLLVVKFTAYYFTGSVAILTDALESIVNVIAGLIGFYSLFVAAQPRDLNHPYGHGKAEFLSAGIEGVLIGIAGLIILYEAIHKLILPSPIRRTDLGIVLVAITALINFAMGAVCISLGKKNRSLALEASGRHLQTDTYSTLAVILGLVILFFTHWAWIDSAVAIVLSVFICYTSYKIIRESVAGIMDEADTKLLSNMIVFINENRKNNWVDIHNLRVIKYGSVLHLDAHLTLPWYFSIREAHAEIDIFSQLIKAKYGNTVELFIHTDDCIEGVQCPVCTKGDCPMRKKPFENRIEWTLKNVVLNQKHNSQATSLNL